MKPYRVIRWLGGMLLGLWLVCLACPLYAVEPENESETPPPDSDDWESKKWVVELRPGFTWLYGDYGDREGFNIALQGGYRFWDNLSAKLDVEYAFFDIDSPEHAKLLHPALGFDYDVDRSRWLPTLGTGIGPLWRKYRHMDWKTDAVWHVNVGLAYQFSRDVALGAKAKYNFVLTDFDTTPLYLTLAVNLVILF